MNQSRNNGLLIIGNMGGTNVGGSLLKAAQDLNLEVRLIEMASAMRAPAVVRRFNWWVRGRRPTRLGRFSREIVDAVSKTRPKWLLATGTAPLNREALEEIGRLGVARMNYLTDDPWNPAHRASWFLNALPYYDQIFSPRRANIGDLKQLGCSTITYLPFAYDESLFFAEPDERSDGFEADVMFAGGADRDRVSYLAALTAAGFKVALYGDYWTRFPETRSFSRGHADPPTLRKAIRGAKVALCLVRKANRDGHVMRTFEVPAVGACMLVEYTEEHREIFGEDRKAVVYFRNIPEMVEKTRWLLEHDCERERLAVTAHHLIVKSRNTYRDRLSSMLELSEGAVEYLHQPVLAGSV